MTRSICDLFDRRKRKVQAALAAFLLCLLASKVTQAQTQPAFVQPHTELGGQLVHEMVPHQPETLFVQPGYGESPIYLDQTPEFCAPVETFPKEVTLTNPPAQNTESQLPPGVRKGLFQKLFFTGSWLPRFDDDSLGINDLEAGIVFGVPFFRVTTPLLITPRFAAHYFDGPVAPDLPARVYDAEITFRHFRKFGAGPWSMMAAVTLGEYSDFEKSDADAFRVTGQAFAIYKSSSATQWIMGVVYLNRKNLRVVPAIGVIYEPSPEMKYEAILPRPRITWRLWSNPSRPNYERWAYLGGEFGGGIWSIQRPISLTQDLLSYNDYRILVGIERKIIGGLSRRLEIGYVFGRELEFDSATPDVDLDDSLFVRGGVTY